MRIEVILKNPDNTKCLEYMQSDLPDEVLVKVMEFITTLQTKQTKGDFNQFVSDTFKARVTPDLPVADDSDQPDPFSKAKRPPKPYSLS